MTSHSFDFPRRRAAIIAACAAACLAAQAQEPAATLPAITVTGEKTARTLQETAPSVRVFTTRDLAGNPSWLGTNDLLEGVANVVSSGTQNLAPAVRGVDGTGPAQGADAFLAGTRPRLNIQVDGRTASYNEVIFGDLGLWDVERVEIFRGAQSTLQGRNALAGTVVYKTHDPSFEREIGARVAIANHRQRQVSGVISGPMINNELAFRLAVDGQRSQSYVGGFQPYAGVSDPGRFESLSVRGKLLWKPRTGMTHQLTIAHVDHTAPQTESVARPFGDKLTSYPGMPTFSPSVNSGVLDSTWDLGNGYTLENRIVAGNVYVNRRAMPGDGNAVIHTRDLMVEPRLRFAPAGGSWSGFVGLYTFRADQRDTIDLFGGGAWWDKTRTQAVYGEATTALSPALDLTLGGRYEVEERRRVGTLAFFTTDFDARYSTFLPKGTLAWKMDPDTTLGATLSRGYNGGGAAFTYDVPYVNYTFRPEYAWTLEGFARQRLLEGRLLLSSNLFYSRYKDMQLPFDLNPDPAVWSYVVRNAPRAETYGAEVAARWLATRQLTLDGELGLLQTRIDRYPGSGIEGNELPRAPALSAVLGASWRPAPRVELAASARYSTAYYSDVTNVARGKVEPGWIADLRANYTVGQARLFAYVNNVFDSQRPIQLDADPNAASSAADTAILPRPRTVGVGMEVWF